MDMGLDKIQVHLDKLARLSKGLRIAVFGGVVAVIFGAYGYFLYMPKSQELAKVEQENLQLQRKLSEVRAVAANEQAVRDEIAALEKKLQVALRQLPDSKELPVLLTDVTSLGKNAGLDFKAITPEEIALSIVAEIVMLRRGGTGRPLREVKSMTVAPPETEKMEPSGPSC